MASYRTVARRDGRLESSFKAVDRAAAVAPTRAPTLVLACAYTPMPEREQRRASPTQLGEEAYKVTGSHPAEDVLRDAEGPGAGGRGRRHRARRRVEGDPVDVLVHLVTERSADLLRGRQPGAEQPRRPAAGVGAGQHQPPRGVRRADRAHHERALARPVSEGAAPLGSTAPVAGGIDLDLPGRGVRLRATRWPGRGDPVVLLHGLASQRRFWNLVAPHLVGVPLLALDQRGHGDSDKPDDDYGYDAVVADLATALDALGLSRAVLVGHSWGASVALSFAAVHPERAAVRRRDRRGVHRPGRPRGEPGGDAPAARAAADRGEPGRDRAPGRRGPQTRLVVAGGRRRRAAGLRGRRRRPRPGQAARSTGTCAIVDALLGYDRRGGARERALPRLAGVLRAGGRPSRGAWSVRPKAASAGACRLTARRVRG